MSLDNLIVSEAHLQLDAKRKDKAERIKHLGEPITLPGKALAFEIRGQHAWIAESTAVTRKLDLQTGKTVQLYKGHEGPVTCLAFYTPSTGSDVLITGAWDKKITLWDTDSKQIISTTLAHEDFVKALYVIPSVHLLISGGSDKVVRCWDLSSYTSNSPLKCVGTLSSHTRPVECIVGHADSDTAVTLYTADTMGVIRIWHLSRTGDSWRFTMDTEHTHHRTKVDEMLTGAGWLWTASTDETVQLVPISPNLKAPKPLIHPLPVHALLPLHITPLAEPYLLTAYSSIIRIYDLTTPTEPEVVKDMDGHWHDITGIRFWSRRSQDDKGRVLIEPWVVTASLDGTLRKWRISDLLKPETKEEAARRIKEEQSKLEAEKKLDEKFMFSEEEERELDELMADD